MPLYRRIRPGVVALALVVALPMVATVHAATPPLSPAPTSTAVCPGDSLYVGDAGDNTVKVFCSRDGRYLHTIISPSSNPLVGPRGLLALSGDPFSPTRPGCVTAASEVTAPGLSSVCGDERLLVANQNVNQPINGEIDQYATRDGMFLGALVPPTLPNAPSAPDGIILGPDRRVLYVADQGNGDLGVVERFDVNTGNFLTNLDFSSFVNNNGGVFSPRGLVFGPNGLLYVSVWSASNKVLGWILSYNLFTGAVNVVASYNPGAKDCTVDLHRPDGLTFGPDGNLYVTSFQANANDSDRIMIVNPKSGACLGEIPLDQAGAPTIRAYAQYLVFGPRGLLYTPIVTTGEVRAYDVRQKIFVDVVQPGNAHLTAGWGLTFGQTNPTTLAYGN